jgi:hypothetical protein
VTTLRELIRSAQRAGRADELATGMLEGLTGRGLPRFERGPEESEGRLAARLIGRFLRWVDSTGRPLEDALVSDATPYLTAVASFITRGDWDPGGGDAKAFLRMHTSAMVFMERRSGTPTPVGHESLFASWLAAQAAMRPTEVAGERLGRLRQRRLERGFGAPAPAAGNEDE